MSFYDFILGFINDDTPLGHLAQYILMMLVSQRKRK